MKTSKYSFRRMIVVLAMSLGVAAPLLAQQDVSPDRFESTSPSAQQTAVHKTANSSTHKDVNKQTARVQHARQGGKQTASLKQASNYQQISRN